MVEKCVCVMSNVNVSAMQDGRPVGRLDGGTYMTHYTDQNGSTNNITLSRRIYVIPKFGTTAFVYLYFLLQFLSKSGKQVQPRIMYYVETE